MAMAWVKRVTDVMYPEKQAPAVFTDYRLTASTSE